MSTRRPGIVIGIGNPYRRDDGIGPAVAAEVAKRLTHRGGDGGGVAGDEVDVVELDGEATRIIEAWSGRRFAIVVDAIAGAGRPGSTELVRIGVDRLPDWGTGSGTHDVGVADAVAMAAVLERLPDHLVVLGVHGADFAAGDTLSPAVAAAVDAVADEVEVLALSLAGTNAPTGRA